MSSWSKTTRAEQVDLGGCFVKCCVIQHADTKKLITLDNVTNVTFSLQETPQVIDARITMKQAVKGNWK